MFVLCQFQPLLAFDETVIGIVITVIWFATWLFKVVATQNQKGPPVTTRPRPPVRPRDEKRLRCDSRSEPAAGD